VLLNANLVAEQYDNVILRMHACMSHLPKQWRYCRKYSEWKFASLGCAYWHGSSVIHGLCCLPQLSEVQRMLASVVGRMCPQ
jgi:hypothetical protein